MPVALSVRFAGAARRLAAEAAARGLTAPAFRSPPRVAGATRTIRRLAGDRAVVAVVLRHRPFQAVAADMVDGVLAVNRLAGQAAASHKAALLAAALADDRAWAA